VRVEVAEVRDQWCAVVNTAVNFRARTRWAVFYIVSAVGNLLKKGLNILRHGPWLI